MSRINMTKPNKHPVFIVLCAGLFKMQSNGNDFGTVLGCWGFVFLVLLCSCLALVYGFVLLPVSVSLIV